MNILLDYFFPISTIEPTPAASTAFLRNVCIVVKPKPLVETGVPVLCTNMAQVSDLTDNLDAQQLFNAGMNRVWVLPTDDLQLDSELEAQDTKFFTLLISNDFNDVEVTGTGSIITPGVQAQLKVQDILYTAVDAGLDGNDITIEYLDTDTDADAVVSVVGDAISVSIEAGVTTAATIKAAIDASVEASALVTAQIDFGDETRVQDAFADANLAGGVDPVSTPATAGLEVGTFKGVVGVASNSSPVLQSIAPVQKRVAFYRSGGTGVRNMFFAFGKLLSNTLAWRNQQYIQMPLADDVDTLGKANQLFDDRISFVLSDQEFGQRLGLFTAGGKAIIAPYVLRNLEIDIQSRALQYISGNQPQYTRTQAALLEDELSQVLASYIERQFIESGSIEVKLEQQNFVASGFITISEPTALWRIFGEVRQA